MTLRKAPHLSLPRFLHLPNGDNNSCYFILLLLRLNEMIHAELSGLDHPVDRKMG